jgi:surface-adhesin protein E
MLLERERKMGILICIFSILQTSTTAQERIRWQRIYTSEDSVIEMNLSTVTFGLKQIARVRFRTTFSKAQPLREMPGRKYKSRFETIEFKCSERRYRIYETGLLDSTGKPLQVYEVNLSDDWKAVRPGSMMERLSGPACNLIAEKRRNP